MPFKINSCDPEQNMIWFSYKIMVTDIILFCIKHMYCVFYRSLCRKHFSKKKILHSPIAKNSAILLWDKDSGGGRVIVIMNWQLWLLAYDFHKIKAVDAPLGRGKGPWFLTPVWGRSVSCWPLEEQETVFFSSVAQSRLPQLQWERTYIGRA